MANLVTRSVVFKSVETGESQDKKNNCLKQSWLNSKLHIEKLSYLLLASICLMLVITSPQAKAETYQDIIRDIGLNGRGSPQAVLDRLEWADAIPDERSPLEERAEYHMWVGKFAALSSQIDKARNSQKRLEAFAEQRSCEVCQAGALIVRGYAASRSNNIPELELVVSQLSPSQDSPLIYLQYLELKAFAFNSQTKIPEMIEVALEAAELAENLNRPSDHIRALNYLVLANIHRRDLERAMSLAEEAYEKAKQINDIEQVINTRSNQGWVYALQGDYPKQAECLKEVLELTENNTADKIQALTVRVNLSHNYLEQEKFGEAIEYANQAIELAEEINHKVGLAVAMHNKAAAIALSIDKDVGIKLLKEAIVLAEEQKSKSYALDMYRSLAKLYEEFDDHESAVEAYKKIIELEAEIIKSEREDAVQALQEQYETEKKNRKIERLSLEKQAADAEIAEKETRQKLWIALAILFLLIAVMLVQWLLTSRKRNKDLVDDNIHLERQTDRDPLTAAYNRRFLQKTMQSLDQKLKSLDRPGRADDIMGIILLDVDFFKNVNDTYGHAVGDAVLVEMTKRFKSLLRERDMVVRWGGEEFVLLLPNINGALCNVADRVIKRIGNETFNFEGQQLKITISAGSVTWPAYEDQSWEDALHLADMAAYLSKSGGRNRATCVTKIDKDADKKEISKDLQQAEKQAWVELTRIEGPRGE